MVPTVSSSCSTVKTSYSLMLNIAFAVLMILANSMSLKVDSVRRVAVVGAGAGGLITADVLRNDGFEVVIFEKETYVGGVWKYRKSIDKSSSTPMYKSLRTNLPKQIMAYSDTTPFKKSAPSFLSHQDVQTYLEDFTQSRELLPFIKFGSTVRSISYVQNRGNSAALHTEFSSPSRWRITASLASSTTATQTSLKDCVESVDYFDAVIVCNGHYNIPLIPAAENIGEIIEFDGEIMHSIDYDTPDHFKGKSVLVVGSRSSGTDLAREISSVASVVYASDRSLGKEKSALYRNIYHKPGISSLKSKSLSRLSDSSNFLDSTLKCASQSLEDDKHETVSNASTKGLVQFADGSIVRVDIILWCTGYAYDYPFLDLDGQKCEQTVELEANTVKVTNKRKVENLYQQVFSISHPTLSFVGLPYAVVPFPLFRLQALWISSVYSRKKILPSVEKQVEWLHNKENEILVKYQGNKELAIEKFHYLGDSQWEYCRFLSDAAGIVDERQLKYIKVTEEIYNDNSLSKPAYPGAPDDYRKVEYSVDNQALTWNKVPF